MSDPPFRPFRPGAQPLHRTPAYLTTRPRAPHQALVPIPGGHTVTEMAAPRFDPARYPPDADLARNGAIGERIVVAGRIADEDGRPQPGVMVEIWQANAAGRYHHPGDTHDAPLDPGFQGVGRVFTDADGWYRFTTIKPGAYPWPNHHNAWRPNHIHYSLFGAGFAQRIVTQMYFPGDPLLPLDPIFNAIADAPARDRLVSAFDLALTQPGHALGYRFDMTMRGRAETPSEDGAHA